MNNMFGFVLDHDITKDIYTIRVEKPLQGQFAWIPKKIRCTSKNISREPSLSKQLRLWAKILEAHLQRPFTNVSDSDRNILQLLQVDAETQLRKSTTVCCMEIVLEALDLLGVGEQESEAKRRRCEEPSPEPNSPVDPLLTGSHRRLCPTLYLLVLYHLPLPTLP